MRSSPAPSLARIGSRSAAVCVGLSCLSMLCCAYAAAQTPPGDKESAPVVVTDAPLKVPHKHRTVKPGIAKPKTYSSNPQPLLKSLRQTRSAS